MSKVGMSFTLRFIHLVYLTKIFLTQGMRKIGVLFICHIPKRYKGLNRNMMLLQNAD